MMWVIGYMSKYVLVRALII